MDTPHQCYYEIVNQAEAWKEAVDTVLDQSKSIRSFFDEKQPGQIIFAGCTSPYYAGNSAATYWQSALGLPVRAVPCSELLQFPSSYYSSKLGKPVLVVLSRSGKTTETLWAVEQFEKQFPGRMLLIGCAPGSPLEKMASLRIMLPKGYEDTVPQTRSFSVMLLAAQMVGALISRQEKTFQDLINSPAMVSDIIGSSEGTIRGIFQGRQFQNIFCLGSGPLFGIAQEATLKMIEMTITDTICVPFMESRHGPRSLIDERSLVIGLYTHAGSGYEGKVMEELTRNHKAVTVAICPNAEWDTGEVSYKIPVNCAWQDDILGLSYLPAIQLLAYYRAVSKGVDPDKSRNLTSFVEIAKV